MTTNPLSILFAGETFDGRDADHPQATLIDGTNVTVRVRLMPQRHLIPLLDYFDLGREADLIERCTQVGTPHDGQPVTWESADAAFVDSLDDASHNRLREAAERLNFTRAVSAAERQIATGTGLLGLKQRMSETMFAPLKHELESWTSQLMQQVSSALAVKKS